jgi:acetylornithine deacetylase
MSIKESHTEAIDLLKKLIETQSFSKEEDAAAQIIRDFFQKKNITYNTHLNNTWAVNKHFDTQKPTLLLNSHIDTVKPSGAWTYNPFEACSIDDKLVGLGSNDAGAALVSLIATFVHFYNEKLPFNILMAATAEEEISGANGIASILDKIKIDFSIVGEPTEMKAAISERGLMVIDAVVHGKAGHAARNEGINSIYLAMEDVQWIKNYQFDKTSSELGPIKMTVTVIEAGKQHNVVPAICNYTIDIRTIGEYTYEEIIEIISKNVHAELKPRSLRLKPSLIDSNHPLVKAAESLNIKRFGSATLSDQALLDIPSIKMGPGVSERSHTADEYILISEIEQGIETYIKFIAQLKHFYE